MTDAPFRVGLLGHGTVGSAFASLLAERADAIEAAAGRRPELSGVMTRSRGDFDEILSSSDAIVELIGGIEPAREYALRALQAGKPLVTANKQLLSQHGDELFAAARDLLQGRRGESGRTPRDLRGPRGPRCLTIRSVCSATERSAAPSTSCWESARTRSPRQPGAARSCAEY